ncbi:MAG TPA: c-type cytochrome [Candidatus Binataceae bacterium]|nr:c-type cytochrome [Candidatus Binataceae bacterium]
MCRADKESIVIVPSKFIRATGVSRIVARAAQPGLAMIVAAVAVFIVAGANAAWCFPWSIDLFRGPAIQPQEVSPRVMPEGTLPTDTGTPPQDLEQATVRAHNPLKPTAENIARGKELFINTCAPCHGESGHGDGPVAHLLHAHGFDAKNLVTGVAKNLPDGYLYGYIRDGGIHMPAYADAMNSDERWDVVMYVRQLEAQASAGGSKTASK